jgi:predicted nucleic acid-binding Zn ribbon protein
MRKPFRPPREEVRPKRQAPLRLGEVLPQLMARRGYARLIGAEDYSEAWRQVAGALAQVSRPGILRRGVLQITVSHSAAVQELTFQKKQLLQDLCKELPEQKIRDLRFVVGSID